MSLTSGLKSITGSAGSSAARRVSLGASFEPEEEETSEVDPSSEDEGSSDGSQDGDGDNYTSGLALATSPYTPLPLDDNLFELDQDDELRC